MEIVRASLEHLEGIKRCAQQAYQHYVERIGKPPAPMLAPFADLIQQRASWTALSPAGAVQGYIVFYPRDGHLHLENVAVHPDHQGQGIGRALIEWCESHAMAHGFRSIELYTNAMMTENLTLYPALGYRETGRLHQDGFDRVFFEKHIGTGGPSS